MAKSYSGHAFPPSARYIDESILFGYRVSPKYFGPLYLMRPGQETELCED